MSVQQSNIDQSATTPQKEHRDRLVSHRSLDAGPGWWEKTSAQPLKFLDLINYTIPSTIFLADTGTSVLAEDLLVRSHHLVINEISGGALPALQRRFGPDRRAAWLLHDPGRSFPEGSRAAGEEPRPYLFALFGKTG